MQLIDPYSPKSAFIFANYFDLALASSDGKVAVRSEDQSTVHDLRKRQEFIQWCDRNQRKLLAGNSGEDEDMPKLSLLRHSAKQTFLIQHALLNMYRCNVCCHAGTQQNV